MPTTRSHQPICSGIFSFAAAQKKKATQNITIGQNEIVKINETNRRQTDEQLDRRTFNFVELENEQLT